MPSKKAKPKKPKLKDLVKCSQCGAKCIPDGMLVCLWSEERFCSDACGDVCLLAVSAPCLTR